MYSLLHMLVDGVCALAMFGHFFLGEEGHFAMLLYNFCAFALQMPMGALLDLLILRHAKRQEQLAFSFAVLGVIVTLLGAFLHPVVLGIGNALFHIGGGVGTIQEDKAKAWQGKGLGVFVAPGALGLYIGTVVAKGGSWTAGVGVFAGILLIGLVMTVVLQKKQKYFPLAKLQKTEQQKVSSGKLFLLVSCCLGVVVLRSYIGMAVAFPWKQEPILACISVLAVVAGKIAGGFAAARYGHGNTTVVTLLLAGIGYMALGSVPMGLAALFLFNMTMPMTLYLLIKALEELPGFSFGLLTFGLFLGFLPVYFGWELPWKGETLGVIGCAVSMVLLVIAILMGGRKQHVSD